MNLLFNTPDKAMGRTTADNTGLRLAGKKVVIIGAGSSGTAAAGLARHKGAYVRLLERDVQVVSDDLRQELLAEEVELHLGQHGAEQFQDADLVILSPGVPENKIKPLLPRDRKLEVISELEMASWFLKEPVIAVTGTNGKTTTCSLIHHFLQHSGKSVFLGGNIGTPLSQYILSGQKADVLVLEVSSFQLQSTWSFRPRVGVLLNFSPNHLDFHRNLEEYFQAKLRLFQNQRSTDLAILPLVLKDDLQDRESIRAKRIYFQGSKRFVSKELPGPHNDRNLEAAYLASSWFNVSEEQARQSLDSFRVRPHRLQRVAEHEGVLYVDDSKSTTLDSLRAALLSFDRPVLLLAGGRFKGGRPEELKDLIGEKVRIVGLFGESREIFSSAWKGSTYLFWEPHLQEAAWRLIKMARPGEVVLLSPAAASFDLFNSYAERGLAFQKIVHKLQGRS